MASECSEDADSTPRTLSGSQDNSLLPFLVLQKASNQKQRKTFCKTKRKIRFLPPEYSNGETPDAEEQICRIHFENSSLESFECVWSKIEFSIKDLLRNLNTPVFNAIHQWIIESFEVLKLFGYLSYSEATCSYPIVTNWKIYTAFVVAQNIEIVDDLLTFEDLGNFLTSINFHVAHLSSSDISASRGMAGCLRTLLRQFLRVDTDPADLSLLATWYNRLHNYNLPLIVIIDYMERCCFEILSDFIILLSEWAAKIHIILIMGVSTALNSVRTLLPSYSLQRLNPTKFFLCSSSERMNGFTESILLKQCSEFKLGYKVATFMQQYFVQHDGTLTSFIRALKIACSHHFFNQPLSFIPEDQPQNLHDLPEELLRYAFSLPSCSNKNPEPIIENLVHGFLNLKKSIDLWSVIVLCISQAGKFFGIQSFDIYCEALNPNRSSEIQLGSNISEVVKGMRDLPPKQLAELLSSWKELTLDIDQIHTHVQDLLSSMKINMEKKELRMLNEKASYLIETMVMNYLQSVESLPFHEIICFKNVDQLRCALIGDTRRRIQSDLLESPKILGCRCCVRSSHNLSPSMHDTSIMYALAQEHGDLINLHDWYQSFKSSIVPLSAKRKKINASSSSKKRKDVDPINELSEASIQARYCRAVTELQIAGLLRIPNRKNLDYVQRITFGL